MAMLRSVSKDLGYRILANTLKDVISPAINFSSDGSSRTPSNGHLLEGTKEVWVKALQNRLSILAGSSRKSLARDFKDDWCDRTHPLPPPTRRFEIVSWAKEAAPFWFTPLWEQSEALMEDAREACELADAFVLREWFEKGPQQDSYSSIDVTVPNTGARFKLPPMLGAYRVDQIGYPDWRDFDSTGRPLARLHQTVTLASGQGRTDFFHSAEAQLGLKLWSFAWFIAVARTVLSFPEMGLMVGDAFAENTSGHVHPWVRRISPAAAQAWNEWTLAKAQHQSLLWDTSRHLIGAASMPGWDGPSLPPVPAPTLAPPSPTEDKHLAAFELTLEDVAFDYVQRAAFERQNAVRRYIGELEAWLNHAPIHAKHLTPEVITRAMNVLAHNTVRKNAPTLVPYFKL